MKTLFKTLLVVASVTATAACSTAPPTHALIAPSYNNTRAQDENAVRQQLLVQYQRWKGAPYRLGGLSPKGIDCSGFVQRTFVEQLGIMVPRTTELQAQVGRPVARNELASGDLVFFKTGVKVRHVGIYVGEGRFLHASTSNGVMISGLEDDYWRDRFWHARRVE